MTRRAPWIWCAVLAAALGHCVVATVPDVLLLCIQPSIATSRRVVSPESVLVVNHSDQEYRVRVGKCALDCVCGSERVLIIRRQDDLVFRVTGTQFLSDCDKFFRQINGISRPYERLDNLAVDVGRSLTSVLNACTGTTQGLPRHNASIGKPRTLLCASLLSLIPRETELKHSNNCQEGSEVCDGIPQMVPPVDRRLALLWGDLILAWPTMWIGLSLRERGWYWLGSFVFGSGVLFVLGGQVLWYLTGFCFSWGWWL